MVDQTETGARAGIKAGVLDQTVRVVLVQELRFMLDQRSSLILD